MVGEAGVSGRVPGGSLMGLPFGPLAWSGATVVTGAGGGVGGGILVAGLNAMVEWHSAHFVPNDECSG